jgi:hypothetical protein
MTIPPRTSIAKNDKYSKGTSMRQSALAFLFCLYSVANAQSIVQLNKPVVCGTFSMIVEQITKTYGEEPQWNGSGAETKFTMLVNPKTQTWTLIEYTNTMACIIGTGEQSTLLRFGISI